MFIKVLIVDDEEGIRNSLTSYLKLEGYEVDAAASGEETIKKLRKSKFNIILLDINMPGKDGLETLEEIKAIDFSIQVIMMTAYSTFDKTMRSLEHGANDYVLKPFENLSEILSLIKISEEKLGRWKRIMSATIAKKYDEAQSRLA